MPPQPSTRRKSRLGSLITSVVILAVVAVVAINRQGLYDWWALRNYQAPAAIASLASQDTMTPTAQHIFYVNHPKIEAKADFNNHCPNNGGEQTIVLGCYIPLQRGIHLYGVSEPQLNGVEQVTAAHEMLHAAYDRMSSSEKKKVDAMLQDYYQHGLQDSRLKATIAAYQKSEPNDVVNEMHSVFGTEATNLPRNLEDHYKKYFSDRQKVAQFADQYQSAFTSRQTQITQMDARLKTLQDSINANRTDLKSQSSDLNAKRQALQSRLASGDTAGYNAQVDQFNQDIAKYNQLVKETTGEINQYNSLVDQRNKIAIEEQNLSQELNSNLQTQSRQ